MKIKYEERQIFTVKSEWLGKRFKDDDPKCIRLPKKIRVKMKEDETGQIPPEKIGIEILELVPQSCAVAKYFAMFISDLEKYYDFQDHTYKIPLKNLRFQHI